MKIFFQFLLFLILSIILSCAEDNAPEKSGAAAVDDGESTDKVIFALDWTPNTNHTGLYVAQKKGYYDEANLQVEFIMPQTSVKQLIAADQAHFGISSQEFATFDMVNAQLPIVSLAAVLQHNTSGFTSLKEKGITRPIDFAGRLFGGWGSEFEVAMLRYLIEKDGGNPEQFASVVMGEGNFTALLQTEMDYAWTYYGWQNIDIELQNAGETNYISLAALDPVFDYYSPIIISSRKRITEQPNLASRFMKAVQKGYEYAAANPDESADILLEYAPELEPQLVRRSQRYLAEYHIADAGRWGIQKEAVWQRLADWMSEKQMISGRLDAAAAMSNDFIEQQ